MASVTIAYESTTETPATSIALRLSATTGANVWVCSSP
jgi:hypothetical protein